MRKISISAMMLPVIAAFTLAACSPTYNWRDYNSPDAPYRVMFPAKPATHTRTVDIDGMQVNMTMAAAEVEDTMFAVGSADAPDPQRAQAAVAAMKTALVRNIGATITNEKTAATAAGATQGTSIDIEASGNRNGVPMRLLGHFESRGTRIYQVIVMGKAKSIAPEQAEQFLTSFKLT
ncbi:MAG: hypothetical protein ACJ8LG_23575 [Massilia sp.]